MTKTMTALALMLALAACNRQPAASNAAAPAPAAPAQTNAVIAPPMAPPATEIEAEVDEPEAETEEGDIDAGQPAPPAPSPREGCAGEIGLQAAQRLANQCREVSPATRPPCNVVNSCAMIREEITRGCSMLGADAPDSCAG